VKIALVLLFISLALSFALISTFVSAEGNITSLRDYKYWDDGKTRGCDIYDPDGHLRARSYNRRGGTVEKIEKFDLNGNKIEAVLYDEKGRLTTGIDGWAAKRWWYEDSRMVCEMSYDAEGKPISKRQYSEGGNLIAAQFASDANIDPYEEANMRLILLGINRNLTKE